MISAKTFDKRKQAIDAAVLALGPEARNGFEFDVCQIDTGQWAWKINGETKPMTQQEAKMQGRRFSPGMPDAIGSRYHPPGNGIANGQGPAVNGNKAATTLPQPKTPIAASEPAKPAANKTPQTAPLPGDLSGLRRLKAELDVKIRDNRKEARKLADQAVHLQSVMKMVGA